MSTMVKFPCNKQCIMNRPLRPETYANFEHIDKEYQQQLQQLKARQARYKQRVEEIRQHVSPTRERTLQRQEATRKCMEEQLALKAKMKDDEKNEERKRFCYHEYLRRFNGPHCVEGHLAREKERRAYLAELMKDNIEMARLRKELEKRDRLRELEMDEIRIRTPSLWNTRHYM